MGQARLRGTREERIAAAMDRRQKEAQASRWSRARRGKVSTQGLSLLAFLNLMGGTRR